MSQPTPNRCGSLSQLFPLGKRKCAKLKTQHTHIISIATICSFVVRSLFVVIVLQAVATVPHIVNNAKAKTKSKTKSKAKKECLSSRAMPMCFAGKLNWHFSIITFLPL